MNYNFLVRLRADTSGIKDLSENTWETNDIQLGEGKFSASSMVFNGKTSYLYNSVTDKVKLLSGAPFTISFWSKWQTLPYDSSNGIVISNGEYSYNGYNLICFNRAGNTLNIANANATVGRASISGAVAKTWHHFAITRDTNNVCRTFIDGALASAITSSGEFNFSKNGTMIGKYVHNLLTDDNNSQGYAGELDDLCIIKDVAVWTDSFTPPLSYLGSTQTLYISEGGGIQ